MSRVVRILIATLAALVVAGPAFAGSARAAAAAAPFGSLTINAAASNSNGTAPDLYVNAMTGDDRNRCLRPEDACLTIQAAIDRIPAVLDRDVVVHIAAGNYGGDLYLGDRISPKRFGVTVLGEPGVVIDGVGTQETGLSIANIASVIIKNLEFRGFTGHGIVLDRVRLVQLESIRLVANQGEGLHAEESSAVIVESIVEQNGGDGIYCTGGVFTIGDSPAATPGVPRLPTRTIDEGGSDDGGRRAGAGRREAVRRGGCLLERGRGDHGFGLQREFRRLGQRHRQRRRARGERTAASSTSPGAATSTVQDNVQFQMMSGCAGLVCRYANSQVSGDCETINYGTCSPN